MIDSMPPDSLLQARLGRMERAVGAESSPPLPLFKAVLFARWHQLSKRGLEEALYHDLRLIRFSGFSITSAKPDPSTFSCFRNALE